MKKMRMVLLAAVLVVVAVFCAPRVIADGDDPLQSVKVFKNLEYVKHGDQSLKLDIYVPEKDDTPYPIIVWIHGGGWLGGNKEDCPPLNMGACQQGYAVASITYRFSNIAPFPAQLEDAKAAIRWLKAHAKEYNIDPNRIGVMGGSAGGHLVSLLGVTGKTTQFDIGENLDQTSEVHAVCNIYGPTDFLTLFDDLAPNTDVTKYVHSRVDSLLGGTLDEKTDLARQASSLTYVDEHAAPFLHAHGTVDLQIPFQQAEKLHDKLRQAGCFSRLFLIPQAGHSNRDVLFPKLCEEIRLFFDQHLKGKNRLRVD